MSDLPSRLVTLCQYRWMIPVLGELQRSRGAKFVTLRHLVGASADSLRRTLDRLIELDLVMRNPGYGHPMRPEYVPTPRGETVGERCGVLHTALRRLDLERICLQKWSLPVLAVIPDDATRFRDIRRALPGVTARALALAVKALSEGNLLDRTVTDDYPPSVTYRANRRGRRVARLALAIAAASE